MNVIDEFIQILINQYPSLFLLAIFLSPVWLLFPLVTLSILFSNFISSLITCFSKEERKLMKDIIKEVDERVQRRNEIYYNEWLKEQLYKKKWVEKHLGRVKG